MPSGASQKKQNIIHRILERRKTDMVFSMKLSLIPGGAVNLFYVLTKFLAGVTSRSFWFIALAIYYALLFSLRFYLLGHIRKNELGKHLSFELKKERNCGILLFVMGIALSVIVFFMVYLNRGYRYPGLLIYVMGGYSVYSVIAATRSLFRYGRVGSPVVVTMRVVKLTAALVSFLSLETAMLSRFGTERGPQFRRILLGSTGGGVCLIVLILAVLMISNSRRNLKKIEKDRERAI